MRQQTTPLLEELVLQWNTSPEDGTPLSIVESTPPQIPVGRLTFEQNSVLQASLLSSIHAFSRLTRLKLVGSGHTLQTILERLHTPSLTILEVEMVRDWRIQWRASFDEAIPNLRGLRLDAPDEDEVMDDDEEVWASPEILRPSTVKWDSVLALHQRSIFFNMDFYDFDRPFLNDAPSYASAHLRDPVPLIQWLVESLRFFAAADGFAYFAVDLYHLSLTDLTTILKAINLIDLSGARMQLSVMFPSDATPLISHLLPHNTFKLSVLPPFECFLDPLLIPACIRSLPNLTHLDINLDIFGVDRCTAATYSFQSTAEEEIIEAHLEISHSGEPLWNIIIFNSVTRTDIETNDPGDKLVDFEMEVGEWFQLSTSLKLLEISFHQ
jgi:hypothetical protein